MANFLQMKLPTNLVYTKQHLWFDPDTNKVGITDYLFILGEQFTSADAVDAGKLVCPGDTLISVNFFAIAIVIKSPINAYIRSVNRDLLPKMVSAETPIFIISLLSPIEGAMNAEEYLQYLQSLNWMPF